MLHAICHFVLIKLFPTHLFPAVFQYAKPFKDVKCLISTIGQLYSITIAICSLRTDNSVSDTYKTALYNNQTKLHP